MRYRWVFFDADGTLFDFDAAQTAALERTWTQAGFEPVPDLLARYQRINMALWEQYEQGLVSQAQLRVERFAGLLAELDHADDGAADHLASTFVTNLSREGRLMDGARELLEELAGACSLAMVTNGIAEVQRGRIDAARVGELFDAIVISGEVGAAKPAAAFFDAAFTACAHPNRDDVIIVGDSLSSDIRGGLDYGVSTCWFNTDGREAAGVVPNHEVGNYNELRDVLGLAGD